MHEDSDALGIERPTHEPRATEYVPQMLEMIAQLERQGPRLPRAERRRQLRGAQVSRLRQALGQVARRAARRRARRGARRQGRSARLRAVEGGQAERARRAQVGQSPCGPGRPGLAHRVLGDVHARCSASTSTSTAAAWTCSSRTTRTRSRRAKARTASRSSTYWMHNGFVQRRQREDVEVARQLLHHPRRAEAATTRETLRFFMLRAHYRSPLNYQRRAPRRRAQRAARLYTALDAVPRRRPAPIDWTRAACGALPRGDGRRLQHADGGGGAVRAGQRGQPHASRRRRRAC